jgi:hypothetical protein
MNDAGRFIAADGRRRAAHLSAAGQHAITQSFGNEAGGLKLRLSGGNGGATKGKQCQDFLHGCDLFVRKEVIKSLKAATKKLLKNFVIIKYAQ